MKRIAGIELTDEATATILAALRYYQTTTIHGDNIYAIASDDNTLTPLDSDEIDVLCEDLNTA